MKKFLWYVAYILSTLIPIAIVFNVVTFSGLCGVYWLYKDAGAPDLLTKVMVWSTFGVATYATYRTERFITGIWLKRIDSNTQ